MNFGTEFVSSKVSELLGGKAAGKKGQEAGIRFFCFFKIVLKKENSREHGVHGN
jgi:hypothetical protein